MEQTALRRIGEIIREIRKKKGLSQEELAEAVGTKHSEIGRLERGERNITVRNLEKIAHALLLQHAYNPVNWYPWSDEALAKA